jgi:hypothetical protein
MAATNVFKLNCDVPETIRTYFINLIPKTPFSSNSAYFAHHLEKYLEDSGDWELPDKMLLYYESLGQVRLNNLTFYIEHKFKDKMALVSTQNFRNNKKTVKHFIYALYYRLTNS